MKTTFIALSISLLAGSVSPAIGTVVAWDGKVLACDSQVTFGSKKSFTGSDDLKIRKIRGHLVGYAGSLWLAYKFLNWFKAGANPKTYPIARGDTRLETIVIDPDGKCWHYELDSIPEEFKPPFAIGSGADEAIGAMKAGFTAPRAVKVAIDTDIYCGGSVHEFKLP